MIRRRGKRSPEEAEARGKCRGIVHSEGSFIRRRNTREWEIGPCDLWPEGVILDYFGWRDLLLKIQYLRENPEAVVNGRFDSATSRSLEENAA